jgi:sugar (pentulose or hexulose) kinase
MEKRMSNGIYAGFDLGTTFFKVGLYTENGVCLGMGRHPFVKDEDEEGHCTVPVVRFLETVSSTFRDALTQAGVTPDAITGVSYCSQANTFLLLDSHDKPLTPLIVWPDLRAAPLSEQIIALTTTDRFREQSGQGIVPAESMLAKLDWLRRCEPELWGRTARIVTISDYLALLLTDRFIGDSGTASLTGLWDMQQNRWNQTMLDFLELDARQLPELHRPGALTIGIGTSGQAWLGIPEGTPFTIGALDHHAAALGGGIGHWAPVSVSFGTSLVCFRFEDDYRPAQGSCLGPATDPGRFYRIAFCAPGAAAMDWYQRDYAPESTFEELLASAEHTPPGCDGLCAVSENGAIRFERETDATEIRKGITCSHPNGANKQWEGRASARPRHADACLSQRNGGPRSVVADSYGGRDRARPSMIPSFHHSSEVPSQGHFVRAVMELTGRNTASLLKDLTCGEGTAASRIIAVGGAAKSDLWMQVVEQTSGVAVSPARPADTAARGAAMFAAVATGQQGSLETCAIRWSKAGEPMGGSDKSDKSDRSDGSDRRQT